MPIYLVRIRAPTMNVAYANQSMANLNLFPVLNCRCCLHIRRSVSMFFSSSCSSDGSYPTGLLKLSTPKVGVSIHLMSVIPSARRRS